mmetsp:Transcript_9884/g.43076  ORF Transcript_9884/g.43076 Transcript_9884/m.43076 type:complete len:244 (-) Transcript_9884:1136-1867(-)
MTRRGSAKTAKPRRASRREVRRSRAFSVGSAVSRHLASIRATQLSRHGPARPVLDLPSRPAQEWRRGPRPRPARGRRGRVLRQPRHDGDVARGRAGLPRPRRDSNGARAARDGRERRRGRVREDGAQARVHPPAPRPGARQRPRQPPQRASRQLPSPQRRRRPVHLAPRSRLVARDGHRVPRVDRELVGSHVRHPGRDSRGRHRRPQGDAPAREQRSGDVQGPRRDPRGAARSRLGEARRTGR